MWDELNKNTIDELCYMKKPSKEWYPKKSFLATRAIDSPISYGQYFETHPFIQQ